MTSTFALALSTKIILAYDHQTCNSIGFVTLHQKYRRNIFRLFELIIKMQCIRCY